MPTTDIDEQTFEASFAEMALTALKSKAPALVDYMMGFQLVDRSDDDTRAVGFFGFNVGEAWVYVPVFFLSAEIKGTELMYVKGQDIFLPLEEGWVNYLIQRKPFVLGKGTDRDRRQQGITGPDLRRLRVPPSDTKTAADAGTHIYGTDAVAPWAPDGMNMFVEKEASTPTLPQHLAHRGLVDSYITLMRKNPKVAAATLQFYTEADFREEEVKTAAARKSASEGGYEKDWKLPKNKKLEDNIRILDKNTASKDNTLDFLTDEEKKRLMTGQVIIDDQRSNDGKRKTYGVEITKELTHPSQGGLYDMLNINGEFTKVFIFIPTLVGGGGTRDLRVIIEPETSDYKLAWKTDIWVSHEYTKQECLEELGKLGTDIAGKPSTGDKRYVVVDSTGGVVISPFTIEKTISNADTTTQWLIKHVRPDVEGENAPATDVIDKNENRPLFEGPLFSEDGEIDLNDAGSQNYNSSTSYDNTPRQIIISDKKLSKIVPGNNASLIPKDAGFRLVKLGKPLTGVRSPGAQADMHLRLQKFAESIKVYSDGVQMNIFSADSGVNETFSLSSEKRAYEVLCRDLHLDVPSAQHMYKVAKEHPHRAERYWAAPWEEPTIKEARLFDEVMGNTGTDPFLGVPVEDSDMTRLTELMEDKRTEDPTNQSMYQHFQGENDAFQQYYKENLDAVDQAAQTGQKDVFDAAAIGSLIDIDEVSDEIDSFIPDLISAVDKLGRLLFMVYWHGEDMQERFGKQEVQHIEDNVKAVFQKLGNTVLDLKKKSPTDEDFLGRGML